MMQRLTKYFLILVMLLWSVPVWGASYTFYFADDGTDNNCTDKTATVCAGSAGCTTDANPCQTMGCFNTLITDLTEGTDDATFCFKDDDTWSISSDATKPKIYKSNVTLDNWGGGSVRPIFDGGSSCWGTENSTLMDILDNAEVAGISNIAITDLIIQNGAGKGIQVGGSVENSEADDVTLTRVKVYNMGQAAIIPIRADNLKVENCEIGHTIQQDLGCSYTNKPQAIGGNLVNCTNLEVRNTYIYQTGNTGVVAGAGQALGAKDGIFEYNTIESSRATAIYADAFGVANSVSIIRYNLIFGTNTVAYNGESCAAWMDCKNAPGTNRNWGGIAISINNEKAVGDITATVYGNIVIGSYAGLDVRSSGGGTVNANIYNNFAIDNAVNFYLRSMSGIGTLNFKNNTSISYDTADTMHTKIFSWDSSNVTIDTNHFYPDDTAEIEGSGDQFETNYISGNPQITKSSGWTSLTGKADFTTAQLFYAANSALISGALDLGNSGDSCATENIACGLVMNASNINWHGLPDTNACSSCLQEFDSEWDFGVFSYAEGAPEQPANVGKIEGGASISGGAKLE
jgi:hypothetical protein